MAPKVKKLYKSNGNRVLTGVIGGLGDYWNVDPTILRLSWIIISVFTGFVPGLIAYILVSLVVPTAK